MNSITKIPAIAIVLFAVVFGFAVFAFASDVFAWAGGTDDGQGGCCGSLSSLSDSNPTPPPPPPPPTSSGCQSNCTPPPPPAAHCVSITANPTQVDVGGSTMLTWSSTNATSATLTDNDGGSITVNPNGSGPATSIFHTKVYTLTVTGPGGSDTCSVTVTVKPPVSFSCDLFTASKSKVEKGETFTLRWETTNATSVSINQGIGSVSADGSITTSTNSDRTYVLTATRGNDSVTCSTSVKVEDDKDDDDDLRCELDISDDEIEKGDSVRLSWDNEGADEILLKDDRGNVLVDTDDGDNYDVDEDDIKVKPTRDTEYRLTVYGKNGDKETCEVDVEVDDKKDVKVDIDRDQKPVVIGIPLTHVPYTGFEAGPLMTALFYILLAVWGAAVAYILVVKRGSVFGFALNGNVKKDVAASTMTAAAPIYTPVSDFAPVPAPVAEEDDVLVALDNKAHEARVLLSTDARNFVADMADTLEGQLAILDSVIAAAKATYPTENGWVVLNQSRIQSLLS